MSRTHFRGRNNKYLDGGEQKLHGRDRKKKYTKVESAIHRGLHKLCGPRRSANRVVRVGSG